MYIVSIASIPKLPSFPMHALPQELIENLVIPDMPLRTLCRETVARFSINWLFQGEYIIMKVGTLLISVQSPMEVFCFNTLVLKANIRWYLTCSNLGIKVTYQPLSGV